MHENTEQEGKRFTKSSQKKKENKEEHMHTYMYI